MLGNFYEKIPKASYAYKIKTPSLEEGVSKQLEAAPNNPAAIDGLGPAFKMY